jgi:hypothetical protein
MIVGLKERVAHPEVRESIARAIIAQNRNLDSETADTFAASFLMHLGAFEWPAFVENRDRNTLSEICKALETLQKKVPELGPHAESRLSECIAFPEYEDWTDIEGLKKQLQVAISKGKEWEAFRSKLGAWSVACKKVLREADSGPAKKHNFNHEAAHIAYSARQLWRKITGEDAPQRGVSATNPFVVFVKILLEATSTKGTGDAAFNASFDHPLMRAGGEQSAK